MELRDKIREVFDEVKKDASYEYNEKYKHHIISFKDGSSWAYNEEIFTQETAFNHAVLRYFEDCIEAALFTKYRS